jgi:hypothetical protein
MKHENFRSFSDADTHFELVKSDTPISVDGYKIGEPTGEVRCEACSASAAAPEYIPHNRVDGEECPQADVVSEYYAELHDLAGTTDA